MKRAPSRIISISNPNTSVQPYLFFGGRCEEALDFYRNAVGAEVQMLTRFKESPEPHGLPDCFDGKIRHATRPIRRHLDGFDRAQARSGRVAFTHGRRAFAKRFLYLKLEERAWKILGRDLSQPVTSTVRNRALPCIMRA